jgi:hypothetical protein
MMCSRRITRLFVFAVLMLFVGSSVVSAHHYHSGTLRWERDFSQFNPTEARILVTVRIVFDATAPQSTGAVVGMPYPGDHNPGFDQSWQSLSFPSSISSLHSQRIRSGSRSRVVAATKSWQKATLSTTSA